MNTNSIMFIINTTNAMIIIITIVIMIIIIVILIIRADKELGRDPRTKSKRLYEIKTRKVAGR